MNELKLLKNILARLPAKAKAPSSDWRLNHAYYPATRVMTIGCPDSAGPYAQFCFDSKGRVVEVKVFDSASTGDTCNCVRCAPYRREPCKCEHSPCEHDAPVTHPKKSTKKKARRSK